ncbi:MAG: hypothetical protein ACOY7T_03005 [Pseudomonadota bacterium]
MSIFNQIDADDRIADAIWFFKGMAAAARDEDTASQVNALAESLGEVRRWMADIGDGDQRLLGRHEGDLRVILAEHEFEKMVDAIRGKPTQEDINLALPLIGPICEQLNFERKRFAGRYDPEVPF